MSGQDSNGDAGVTLRLSGRPKRTSSDGGVENGAKAHQGRHPARPRHGSGSCVVCFGIDDSTLCEQTFNWYLDHIHRERSYLVLINCVELPSLYSYQEVYTPSAMWQTTLRREAEQAQQLEEKYVNKLKCHNIAGRYVIRDGKPGEGIVKMSKECDADMIVVGTRGLGKVRRTLLGSVSSYVIHHAHVPVIVGRPRGPHEHNDIGRKHSDGKKERTSSGKSVHCSDG
ncbi:Usp domain-containing protein [Lamellibrachia satsuma]|nr:Usp domain-containing protein [Lamellibrachia satsuma]